MDITKLNKAIEQDNQAKLKEEQKKLEKKKKEQQDVKEFIKKLGLDEDIIKEKEKEYINSIKNYSDDILQEVLEDYLKRKPDLRGEEKLTLGFINGSDLDKKVSILQKYDYERAYEDCIENGGPDEGIEDLWDYIDACRNDDFSPMHLSIKTELNSNLYLMANCKLIGKYVTYTNKTKYEFNYLVEHGLIMDDNDRESFNIISKALKEIIANNFTENDFDGLSYKDEIYKNYKENIVFAFDNINLVIDTLKERLEDFGFKIIDIKSDTECKNLIWVTVKNPLLEQ